MKLIVENWRKHLNEQRQRDQRPRKEPTPFKSKAQKKYKKKRKKNDIYSTISGHKNLKTGAPFTTKPRRSGTDRLRFEEVEGDILLESIESATRLSIFDFDETIAFTEGYINVIDKETGEEFQTKSQEEYDAIKDSDRYEFDFSPLETSDIIMIGVEGQNKGNYLANVVLSKYENIKEVEFYDDSQGNIDDMIQIKKELDSIDRGIKFDIYLVKHGRPELVSS